MRKIIFLWLHFLFLFTILFAEEREDTMCINSEEAFYDGKEITLVGQVAIEHPLGKISSRRLSVQPSLNMERKNKFAIFQVDEGVYIQLKEGGELSCEHAKVDLAKMNGLFSGNTIHPDVVYHNQQIENQIEHKNIPSLELKSLRMEFELMQDHEPPSSSQKTLVKQIVADKQVRVKYNKDYLITADQAIYRRSSNVKGPIGGIITFTPQDTLNSCVMKCLNGDTLSANAIQLNTLDRKLWLNKPVGKLHLRQESTERIQSAQLLDFSADELFWEDPEQILRLKGNVDIKQNPLLTLQTPYEVSISQTIIEGKKTVKTLSSKEETTIHYLRSEKEEPLIIHCPGPITIDHQNHAMTLLRSNDDERQVYIEGLQGEMYANHVFIQYTWEGQFQLKKMVLEGNVRLVNRSTGHKEDSGSIILHYALADRVEYFPQQQEMLLTSNSENRVLFFDKVNNIQMSAPSLKVQGDTSSKNQAIQGFGDVRFTFLEKELEQLKNHFSFQKETKGAKRTK